MNENIAILLGKIYSHPLLRLKVINNIDDISDFKLPEGKIFGGYVFSERNGGVDTREYKTLKKLYDKPYDKR